MKEQIEVEPSESGLKLIGLLQRRLGLPPALFHRWIRTGQVRLNGSRTQAFVRVSAGDLIRLPPFAEALAGGEKKEQVKKKKVEILGRKGDLLAVFKPAGLPTHPGTKQADSLVSRLEAESAFAPTPVHRLDRDTSGVLLVAMSFQALQETQELFRKRAIHKEYLAWVAGIWPEQGEKVLRHYLAKRKVGAMEKMVASSLPSEGQEAVLVARPIRFLKEKTLLLVRLFTGRTHQIRVQLATVGFPIIGDGKYGKGGDAMYLHSLRTLFDDGTVFEATPRWGKEFALSPEEIPSPILKKVEAS